MHKIKPIYFAVLDPSLQQLGRGHGNAGRPGPSLTDVVTPTVAFVWQLIQMRESL